jgi:uncharacterized protein (TIGR00251 family)
MNLELRETADGLNLQVRVQPGAKRSKFVGAHGGAIKIAIAAPPVDGKANEELVDFLSSELDIKKSHIEIIRGQTSRDKTVLFRGLSDEVLGRLFISVQR